MQVVEIAPAPALSKEIKEALYADAVKLAKHVGYRNAGQLTATRQLITVQQLRRNKQQPAMEATNSHAGW